MKLDSTIDNKWTVLCVIDKYLLFIVISKLNFFHKNNEITLYNV